jgi:Transglycosylase-like domain
MVSMAGGDAVNSGCQPSGSQVAWRSVVSRARAALGAVLVTTTLVSTTSLAVFSPRPAAADQVASLQAQAKQIAQELVQEQLQIGADEQQYSVAQAKVASDTAAMARIGREIDTDNARIAKDSAALRHLALAAYMTAGTDLSGSDAIFSGNFNRVTLSDEYQSLSAGNIQNAIDELHDARAALAVESSVLQQEQSSDRAARSLQASSLAQASATNQQMEAKQSEVKGQLVAALAAQAAAQAAAAQAAVAAAQRAASQKAAAAQAAAAQAAAAQAAAQQAAAAQAAQQAPSGSSAGASTVVEVSMPDPALPPYLQCVVQAESGGNYQAVSPDGVYMGAFQFDQPTWDLAARAAGLAFLVGVQPNDATKAEQDTVAVALYALDGDRPWLGDRCQP